MSNEFKPFFIHFSRPVTKNDSNMRRSKPRGFTAFIQPSELPRNIQVAVAFCAGADEFHKKEGRSQAQLAETIAINPRDLPNTLATCANACGLYEDERLTQNEYLYTLKYVL